MPSIEMVMELRAEIERLTAENENLSKWHGHWHSEAARLRTALKEIADEGADLGGAWCAAQAGKFVNEQNGVKDAASK